jgi:hypothetical protein
LEGEKAYPNQTSKKTRKSLVKKQVKVSTASLTKKKTKKGNIDALNEKSGGTLTTYAWEDLVKNENLFGSGTDGEYGAGMLWKVSIFSCFSLFFFGRGCSVRCAFLIFLGLFF